MVLWKFVLLWKNYGTNYGQNYVFEQNYRLLRLLIYYGNLWYQGKNNGTMVNFS